MEQPIPQAPLPPTPQFPNLQNEMEQLSKINEFIKKEVECGNDYIHKKVVAQEVINVRRFGTNILYGVLVIPFVTLIGYIIKPVAGYVVVIVVGGFAAYLLYKNNGEIKRLEAKYFGGKHESQSSKM
jgi:hypothetical protein